MSYTCPICGQQHDTTACPQPIAIPSSVALPPNVKVEMTLNGMPPFETALLERLDKLINLVHERLNLD